MLILTGQCWQWLLYLFCCYCFIKHLVTDPDSLLLVKICGRTLHELGIVQFNIILGNKVSTVYLISVFPKFGHLKTTLIFLPYS